MVKKLLVVGAGLMGSGIAQVAASSGMEVVLRDVDPGALERSRASIESSLAKLVEKGRLEPEAAETALSRLSFTTDPKAGADADFVVEAVYEDLDLKKAVFAELDALVRPGVILATNTSALPITAIASATTRPDRVVGTHFFSPVPLMSLCEIVKGLTTSEETTQEAVAFARALGKETVVVRRDVAGFLTTRLLIPFVFEAVRMVESGVASPEEVDRACVLGFNHRMGPLATADLTGIDVLYHAALNIWRETGDPKFYPPELLRRMVDAGRLGRKTGQGFYSYA